MIYEKHKSFSENDVVLIYIENNPAFFARVEKIIADKKPGWWQMTLLVLQIPLITLTWILDNEQIRGADFTMKGTPVRIEKVVAPNQPQSEPPVKQNGSAPSKQASILSLGTKKSS